MAKAKVKGGRGMKGGRKSTTNKNFRIASRRGVVKHRWDDIVAQELQPGAVIGGRPQEEVIKDKVRIDPDKPGLGQFYCVACCRYCISQKALDDHQSTSKHKRRLKTLLTEKPYSHAEAMAGAGKGATDHGQARTPRAPDEMAMSTD